MYDYECFTSFCVCVAGGGVGGCNLVQTAFGQRQSDRP